MLNNELNDRSTRAKKAMLLKHAPKSLEEAITHIQEKTRRVRASSEAGRAPTAWSMRDASSVGMILDALEVHKETIRAASVPEVEYEAPGGDYG